MFQIEYLIQNISPISPEYKIVSVQACHSLQDIFENEDMVDKVSPHIVPIVTRLIEHIPVIKLSSFFGVIEEVVE